MVLKIDPETKEPETKFPSDLLEDPSLEWEKGEEIPVKLIKVAGSGKGYALFTDFFEDPDGNEYTVMDFLWKNSKAGKAITSMFADVSVADDTEILLVIQADLRSAVIRSRAFDGARWNADEPNVLEYSARPVSLSEGKKPDGFNMRKRSQTSPSPSTESESPET